ncbi:cytochrome c oxidase subunit 3 [Brachybacterium phenoliresistens]|uniref:cytochrome-c oxidase n=1 Tax=Brachybacterium phenoliresistens TaxID=396014 RepID=Z9JYN2_9MICO|nr:heme-copper oxidase subunit III [Brachybacterium phenoliresistens]EWS82902.1 cytochrome B561 [Brachybacterium phenoliresistens]
MTTATLPQRSPAVPAVGRPNATQVGTLVWLSSELMFFAGLFAMFFTLRAMAPETFYEGEGHFTHGFAMVNTAILVFSSVTCQMGVWMAEGHLPWTGSFEPRRRRTGSIFNLAGWGMVEWYTLTFVLGSVFVAGQAYEYTELIHHGVTLSSSPFGSVFYLSTGFHGLHVVGGLIAFLFVLARAFAAEKFTHHEQVSAICISYYWHFVDVVWIGLFSIVYLLDPIMGHVPWNLSVF